MSIARALSTVVAMTAIVATTACHAAGPRAGSEIRHETRSTGDAWHATTRAPIRIGERTSWITIDEDVELDAAGRLIGAELRVRDDAGSPAVHVVFDPPARKVSVDRAGRHDEWTVPAGDAPWILEPVRGPDGRAIPTPLVAWTTYRAAERTEWVRLVRPLAQDSFVVPRDQHVVDETVILGDEAVDVNESFVRRMRMGAPVVPPV